MLARATHSHMGRDVLTSVAVHYGRVSNFNRNEQCDFWFFVFRECFEVHYNYLKICTEGKFTRNLKSTFKIDLIFMNFGK